MRGSMSSTWVRIKPRAATTSRSGMACFGRSVPRTSCRSTGNPGVELIETAVSREIVPVVVQQHADAAISLRNIRSGQVTAPHVNLSKLRRLDDRIAAHLDGLAIAGRYGTSLAMAALAKPGRGEAFVAAVQAIETRDSVGMEKLL